VGSRQASLTDRQYQRPYRHVGLAEALKLSSPLMLGSAAALRTAFFLAAWDMASNDIRLGRLAGDFSICTRRGPEELFPRPSSPPADGDN